MPKKDIIPAENAEIVTEFKPTSSQIVWLDTAVEYNEDSPTKIEEKSNISRQSWYRWLKEPGFEDWFYSEYAKRRRRWLPTLDKIGMTQARKGEYNFWKDMNKKAGDNLDSPQVQINSLKGLIQVNVKEK